MIKQILAQLVHIIGMILRAIFKFLGKILSFLSDRLLKLVPNSNTRYRYIGGVLAAMLCLLIFIILKFIQSEDAKRWREIGETIHRPSEVVFAPLRGSIYASDGRPISITSNEYRLFIDFQAGNLELLHRAPKDSTEAIKKQVISECFSADLDSLAELLYQSFKERDIVIDRQKMRDQWRQNFLKKSRYAPIINRDLTYLQYSWLKQQTLFKSRKIKIGSKSEHIGSLLGQAITTVERSKRMNPFGSLALRTIGSVYGEKEDALTKGKQGIELSFDSVLKGEAGKGFKIYALNRQANKTLKPAVDGYDVYTTLNMNLQSQLERIMRARLEYFKATSGTAILLDVPTGKVLALTNLMRSSSGNYVEGRNDAVSDLSEPGSTFKVASMLVALNNKMVRPTDTIDVGNGLWMVGGKNVRDHNAHHGGYGKISVSQVIENSSNVGIAKIIQRNFANNPSSYVKQVRDLAFGYDLRVEIPGSAKPIIRMPQKDTWYKTTLAWMSFGYETQIPPMYTAAFFNAIANGGKLMKPYLVEEVRNNENQTIYKYEPKVVKEQIGNPTSIRQIQDMLRRVVTHGTGKKSINSNIVEISGKSGTAQIAKGGSYKANGLSHQVSFCGYFPSSAPRYTLMVVIREPSKEFAAGGGSMAGPVVKDLAEAITSMETPSSLDSLIKGTPKSKGVHVSIGRKNSLMQLMHATQTPYRPDARIMQESFIRIDSTGKETKISPYARGLVPNLVGMSAQDATYLLLQAGYRTELSGYGYVRNQTPSAGSKLPFGSKVILNLGF